MADKPTVLIIGGLGYIGRFLALHIEQNGLASDVRLVDKVLPQLAWLAPEFKDACSQDKFVQADGCQAQSLPRIFDRADGKEFDYVFNCAGETRFSQDDEIYNLRIVKLAENIGKEAARRGVKCFVEFSTGNVYKGDSSPRKETDKLKPSMKMASYKLKAEEVLQEIKGLNLVILRLGLVYGKYDTKQVAKSLVLGRVYKSLDEELRWLWTKDTKINTVHVTDAARSAWAAASWLSTTSSKPATTPIFNVVDHTNTSQGHLAALITSAVGVQTSFVGSILSTFAKLNMDNVLEDINEAVMGPWAELLDKEGMRTGPLNPFMEKEQVKDEDLCLDGALFETTVGFEYERERFEQDGLEEMITSYKEMGWWP